MNTDSMNKLSNFEILELLVTNGVLMGRWQKPLTIYDAPAPKKPPDMPYDHPVMAYHRHEISDTELCKKLRISRDELYPYLVRIGKVFNFSSSKPAKS